MRLISAGTPDFAARALEALHAAGHEIPLVLTQPDRPAGRGMKLQASAVKTAALARGLAVFQPERLKDPATHAPLREVDADIMVVAAYGLILPQAVLDIPRLGCINIHASLLPRWRGAAPIHRAIEAGDAATGITLMQMDAGLDTGAMLLRQACPILAADTSGSLHDRLAALGAHCIVDLLGNIAQGKSPPPVPQPSDGVTYASKIDKAEARLEWSQPAASLARKVRAFNPFPGASATIGEETLKIWQAAEVDVPVDDSLPPGAVVRGANKRLVVRCGEGALELLEVQSPGGKRTTAREWLGRQASAA